MSGFSLFVLDGVPMQSLAAKATNMLALVRDSLESHHFFSSVHCRRFEESHVAQIKTVFPDAYTFRQEKDVPTFTSSFKKGSYQLTVEPIISAGEVTTHSWPSGAGSLCMCPPHLALLTSVLRPE